jgi:hypothetical protein
MLARPLRDPQRRLPCEEHRRQPRAGLPREAPAPRARLRLLMWLGGNAIMPAKPLERLEERSCDCSPRS